MGRLKLFLPLLIFVLMAGVFFVVLQSIENDEYNPQELDSPLIDRKVPAFSLPSLENESHMLSLEDLNGKPYLLNVWATWCPTCRAEHPFLNQLSEEGVVIVGVDYKDERAKALKWLEELGNPFSLNIYDEKGSFGLDLGVSGAPETYFVDANGVIRYKHVGDINGRLWKSKLQEVYRKSFEPLPERQEQGSASLYILFLLLCIHLSRLRLSRDVIC